MNIMKKYVLLVIPLILLGRDLYPYFNFQVELQIILNMIITLILLVTLLKRTTLENILDWIIGICFSLYFCILYLKTVRFSLIYSPTNDYTGKYIGTMITNSVNLIPLSGIVDTLRYSPTALYQIIGNTVMLAPLTFTMLYFKWVPSAKKALWYSFLCTLSIECIQLVQTVLEFLFGLGQARSTDVDDVILNTLGAVIGVICYAVWAKLEERLSKKTQTTKVYL